MKKDAKTVTVTVTRKHFTAANKALAKGRGKLPLSKVCPVAQALKDVFPGADVDVCSAEKDVEEEGLETRGFDLSAKGASLIAKFDSGTLRAKDLPVTFRMRTRTFAA